MMTGSADENVPDGKGLVRYHDRRKTSVNGQVTDSGGLIVNGRTDDVHWNGTAWVPACTADFTNTSTVRNSDGAAVYNYCDGFEKGISKRTPVDVSGKTVAELVSVIRSFPGHNGNVNFAAWGSSDGNASTPLASAMNSNSVLPTGSKLYYYDGYMTERAWTYINRSIPLTSEETAKGGNATKGDTPACANPNNQAFSVTPTTLDQLIANNKGTPCIFGVRTPTGKNGVTLSSDGNDEWWSQSTVSMGAYCPSGTACLDTVSTWDQASAFYTGRVIIRVAFTDDGKHPQQTTYYACKERIDGGSARNCKVINTGTYSITTLGGLRVMSFQNLPPQTALVGWQNLLIEKNNAVMWGYVGTVGAYNDIRINLTAINALFNVLGIPQVSP
jgi:hypothetical protein